MLPTFHDGDGFGELLALQFWRKSISFCFAHSDDYLVDVVAFREFSQGVYQDRLAFEFNELLGRRLALCGGRCRRHACAESSSRDDHENFHQGEQYTES